MRSRNYTKEIGIEIEERPVPMLASAAICALVVVVAVLFARQVNTLQPTDSEPAHSTAPVKVTSR